MSRKIDYSKPLSEEEIQYIKDRPWMIGDAQRLGFNLDLDGGEPSPSEVESEDETGEDEELDEAAEAEPEEDDWSYDDLTKAELKAEIDARNAELDEDDQIVPEGSKKDDLIAALVANDDAAKDEDDEE